MDLIYITYHDNKLLAGLGSVFVFTPELKSFVIIKARGLNQLWLSMWFCLSLPLVFYFALELKTINQNEVEEFKPAIAINVVFPFFPTRILF